MPTYHEMIIKGDETKLCAYLDGFLAGKGVRDGLIYSKDHPFHLHHLREMIKYHGEVLHVICTSAVRSAVAAAIRRASPRYDFEVEETLRVRQAHFEFEFKTASRKVASQIKRMMSRPPSGTRVADYNPQEVVDPSAAGAEGYAPVHEYVFKGNGRMAGDVGGILKVHTKMKEHEFIRVEDIELDH